jgi:hypothetical protein
MARTSGRRSGSQYGRRRSEEYGRDEEFTPRGGARDEKSPPQSAAREDGGGEQSTDSLIADMAKGFVAAQAQIAGQGAEGGNQEMLALLDKISRQLAQLQAKAGDGAPQQQGQGGGRQQTGGNQQSSGAQQSGGNQQAELSALFSQLLTGNKADGGEGQGGGQSAGSGQGQAGQNRGAGQGKQGSGGKTVAARSAAQALAQAQYDLANELEASLAKLKQVISESEQLADRIGNLLGQESDSRQS